MMCLWHVCSVQRSKVKVTWVMEVFVSTPLLLAYFISYLAWMQHIRPWCTLSHYQSNRSKVYVTQLVWSFCHVHWSSGAAASRFLDLHVLSLFWWRYFSNEIKIWQGIYALCGTNSLHRLTCDACYGILCMWHCYATQFPCDTGIVFANDWCDTEC